MTIGERVGSTSISAGNCTDDEGILKKYHLKTQNVNHHDR